MSNAASLHCPNCGAPVDPGARRCQHCEARLATVSCPACFGLMFDGAAFCPRCGVRRDRTERPDAPVHCPGCRTAMRQVDVGSTTLLECGSCDGIWMDAAIFERLCADQDARAAVLHTFTDGGPRRAERVAYRPCPRCGKMMNRINFGRLSGTIVDVCRGHGTYLDPGELHRIVLFIQEGGLERARARQLEELKERERAVRDAEAAAARARGRSDPHATLGWDTWVTFVGD